MLRVIISEASHQCSQFQEHHSAHWGGLKAHMVGFSLTHSIVLPSFPYTYSLLHYAFAAKSASLSTSPLNCSRLSGFKYNFQSIVNIWIHVKCKCADVATTHLYFHQILVDVRVLNACAFIGQVMTVTLLIVSSAGGIQD